MFERAAWPGTRRRNHGRPGIRVYPVCCCCCCYCSERQRRRFTVSQCCCSTLSAMAALRRILSPKFLEKSTLLFQGTKSICPRTGYCSLSAAESQTSPSVVAVSYHKGLPSIILPLPSRAERCKFTVRPIGNTLQDLMDAIRNEDHGVDFIVAHTLDGCRIAGSTSVELLLQEPFNLTVNNAVYKVEPPAANTKLSAQEEESLADVKKLVNRLYENLTVSEHQLEQERKILEKIEKIQFEVEPLEKLKDEIARQSQRRTTILGWTGLGLMGVQFGVLARLTWWEYSWDIMEPVTYFVTYGTSMAAYAYFMVTKQDYYLPDVRDREFLKAFWKGAKLRSLDLDKYNELRNTLAESQEELRRLRDPLQGHLPLGEICDDCVLHKEYEEKRRKDEF